MSTVASRAVLALLVALASGGCMSFANLTTYPQSDHAGGFTIPETRVYGGVQLDVHHGCRIASDAFQVKELSLSSRVLHLVEATYFFAVDLPACVVMDTVTLPISLTAEQQAREARIGQDPRVSSPVPLNEPLKATQFDEGLLGALHDPAKSKAEAEKEQKEAECWRAECDTFSKIKSGMTRQEVEAVLGGPSLGKGVEPPRLGSASWETRYMEKCADLWRLKMASIRVLFDEQDRAVAAVGPGPGFYYGPRLMDLLPESCGDRASSTGPTGP